MDLSKLRGRLCSRHHAEKIAQRLKNEGIPSIVIPGSGPLQRWQLIETDLPARLTVSRKDRVCLG